MYLRYTLIVCCLFSFFANAQDCPTVFSPAEGSIDISLDTTISWNAVEGVTGYIISIGTSDGAVDIINNQPVGTATSYTPPLGLPDNSQIFVTITLFFLNQSPIACPSFSFTTLDYLATPDCTILQSPANNAIDINVASSLFWNYTLGAVGYRLTLGTSTGAGDIINDFDVGNTLSYKPTANLPAGSLIFLSIISYNENGVATGCIEYSFTTATQGVLPICTTLLTPADGAINVALSPLLEWESIPNADGYIVTIGTTPFNADILDRGVFSDNSTYVLNFEPNRTFFVLIIPYNDAGFAFGCAQESFSTILGCGPFFDPLSGQLVNYNPLVNLASSYSICKNSSERIVSSTLADGHRWFFIDIDNSEQLLSENNEFTIDTSGKYRYEAYNTILDNGVAFECVVSHDFEVIIAESDAFEISSIDVTAGEIGPNITININDSGEFEYALHTIDGPYRDANIFENVPDGSLTVYAKRKNGCGTAEATVQVKIPLNFPKFFTPNGDGINEYWYFKPPSNSSVQITYIYIYDRLGTLITRIDPSMNGWDGTMNGNALPSADYWYTAITTDNNSFKGHFTLKR